MGASASETPGWAQLPPVSPRFLSSFLLRRPGMAPSFHTSWTESIPAMCLLEVWTASRRAHSATPLFMPGFYGGRPSPPECSVLGALGVPGGAGSGLGRVCPPRPPLPGWHWPCRTRSCCYCFVLACHPHCVAWAAARKCMSEQFLITFHFLPNSLSLLSIEILWAGYKMGWHRAMDGRPWIWF